MILQTLLLLACTICQIGAAEIIDPKAPYASQYPNFSDWASECDRLPYYKYIDEDADNDKYTSLLSYTQLYTILTTFIALHIDDNFNNKNKWIGLPDGNASLRNYFSSPNIFQPFLQKHILNSNTKIIFKGDLHGDIHSLIAFIRTLENDGSMDKNNSFEIIDDSLRIVFLGDYSDKGIYGTEVLYTILRLKLANPDKVFLIRGNHEDCLQNITGGLFDELLGKLSDKNIHDKNCIMLTGRIKQMYNFLPVCLFLGIKSPNGFINYIQCCHGGMELGHNQNDLLQAEQANFELLTHCSRLYNSRFCACISEKDIFSLNFRDLYLPHTQNYSQIGYMWSDFAVSSTQTIDDSGRGDNIYSYGPVLTKELLQKCSNDHFKICAIMRGHQQVNGWTELMEIMLDRHGKHPEEAGCAKLWREVNNEHTSFWNGIVCTLMVSPDNALGEESFNYPGSYLDYWATLHTVDDFNQWRLVVRKNSIYPNKNDR